MVRSTLLLTLLLANLSACGRVPVGANATALPTARISIFTPLPSPTHAVPTPAPTTAPTATTTIPPTATIPTIIPTQTGDGQQTALLLELVNELRVQNGCLALAPDPLLAQTAQSHADDMRQHQFIDHTGSDGFSHRQRLDRVGYPAQLSGENIAAYPTAEEVMQMWTEGAENPDGPHRQNILNCAYTEAGIGLAIEPGGWSYWVLDLANRQ